MHPFSKDYGYFYLIQLQPESRPDEFKIGYSKNYERKMYECWIFCPQAILVSVWPCKQEWESDAVIHATNDILQVSNRVYRGDINLIIEKLHNFFEDTFLNSDTIMINEENLDVFNDYNNYMVSLLREVKLLNDRHSVEYLFRLE